MSAERVYTPEEIDGELETAKYIVYPSNVTTLAAIVEQQRAEIEGTKRDHESCITTCDILRDQLDELRVEIKRLKSALSPEEYLKFIREHSNHG